MCYTLTDRSYQRARVPRKEEGDAPQVLERPRGYLRLSRPGAAAVESAKARGRPSHLHSLAAWHLPLIDLVQHFPNALSHDLQLPKLAPKDAGKRGMRCGRMVLIGAIITVLSIAVVGIAFCPLSGMDVGKKPLTPPRLSSLIDMFKCTSLHRGHVPWTPPAIRRYLISRSTSHLPSHLTPGCHDHPSQVGSSIDQTVFLQSHSPATVSTIDESLFTTTYHENGTSHVGLSFVKPVGLVGLM